MFTFKGDREREEREREREREREKVIYFRARRVQKKNSTWLSGFHASSSTNS